jgi:hypothetical protein
VNLFDTSEWIARPDYRRLRVAGGAVNSPLFELDRTGALILAIVADRPSQT